MADSINPFDTAINRIAAEIGVSPEAVKQVIHVESNFDPRASTGSYNGLTQIGPDTFKEAGGTLGGLTYGQYLKASPEAQVGAYGDYLKHYNFAGQMERHGIDVSSMSPDQQFAVLQGMQLSPNGQSWKAALANGDLSVPVTNTRQATALGNTSIGAMAGSQYGRLAAGAGPLPTTQVAALPPITQPISGPTPLAPQRPLPPQPLNLAEQGQMSMPAYGFSPQQPAPQVGPDMPPTLNAPQLQPLRRQLNLARAFQNIPLPPGFRGYSVG